MPATDRCGFVSEIATVGETGAACCLRPTGEEFDRRVWHAETVGKPREALEAQRPGPGWLLAQVFFRSLYFSAVTFATLGYGDIQPVGAWARAIAGLESLLGSLPLVLLVFVLTRRMRWITGPR